MLTQGVYERERNMRLSGGAARHHDDRALSATNDVIRDAAQEHRSDRSVCAGAGHQESESRAFSHQFGRRISIVQVLGDLQVRDFLRGTLEVLAHLLVEGCIDRRRVTGASNRDVPKGNSRVHGDETQSGCARKSQPVAKKKVAGPFLRIGRRLIEPTEYGRYSGIAAQKMFIGIARHTRRATGRGRPVNTGRPHQQPLTALAAKHAGSDRPLCSDPSIQGPSLTAFADRSAGA